MVQCIARKPDWETGASSALPRSSKLRAAAPVAPQAPQPQRPPAADVWTMAADDDEEELLDDNELLTEEDLKRPEVPSECIAPPFQNFAAAITCWPSG